MFVWLPGACTTFGAVYTDIGCASELTVDVPEASDEGLYGTITVGSTAYAVDCREGGTSDPVVTCDGNTITLSGFGGATGSDLVDVDLATDGGESVTHAFQILDSDELPVPLQQVQLLGPAVPALPLRTALALAALLIAAVVAHARALPPNLAR